jgi:hypothetical protein
MLTALLLLQLAATDVSLPANTIDAREQARLRGGVGFVLAGGFSGVAGGVGPGVGAEVGLTLRDRVAFVARASFGTIFVVAAAQLGIALSYALSDHVELGAGLSAGFAGGLAADLPRALTAHLPLRVVWAPTPRAADATRRTGLVLFLEAAPGFVFDSSLPRAPPVAPSPFAISLTLGIGYAWW